MSAGGGGRRRKFLIVAIVGVPLLPMACSSAEDAVRSAMVGSFDCTMANEGGSTDEPPDEFALTVSDDGRFELSGDSDSLPSAARTRDGDATGEWKVVDKDLGIDLAGTAVNVVGFADLAVDVGSVTVETPSFAQKKAGDDSDPGTEIHEFDLDATGIDSVRITYGDKGKNRWPSLPWTCERVGDD